MNTRNVTNTAFTSYPATGVQLPNGRQLANTYDVLYRRTLVQDVTNSVNVAAWQFFGPSRVAEVTLGNGLVCSWMDNARTHSAVQPAVANPAWGNQSSDRLGYDGAGRPITKRYLAGGINGSTHAYNNPSAVVGFTTEYDLASNKFYERHLHAAGAQPPLRAVFQRRAHRRLRFDQSPAAVPAGRAHLQRRLRRQWRRLGRHADHAAQHRHPADLRPGQPGQLAADGLYARRGHSGNRSPPAQRPERDHPDPERGQPDQSDLRRRARRIPTAT